MLPAQLLLCSVRSGLPACVCRLSHLNYSLKHSPTVCCCHGLLCCVMSCRAPQALRSAFDRFCSSHSFEVVLHEADTAADSGSSSSGGGGSGKQSQSAWGSVKYGRQAAAAGSGSSGGGGGGGDGGSGAVAAERLHTLLLRRPAVFTLAVVWESPKVSIGKTRKFACHSFE